MRVKYDLKPELLRWGPALLMMMLIFSASSLPSNDIPNFGKFDFSVKKLGHTFGYFLLGLSYLRGFGRDKPRHAWAAWLLAALYAASDELHQRYTPGRGPHVFDVGIDSIGAALGIGFSLYVLPRFQSPKKRSRKPGIQE
jgi:VanZ family protein